MGIETLLKRTEIPRRVTSDTRCNLGEVTANSLPSLPCTRVSPVTPSGHDAAEPTRFDGETAVPPHPEVGEPLFEHIRTVWQYQISDRPGSWLVLIAPEGDSEEVIRKDLLGWFGKRLVALERYQP
jgi:hypothetical protein